MGVDVFLGNQAAGEFNLPIDETSNIAGDITFTPDVDHAVQVETPVTPGGAGKNLTVEAANGADGTGVTVGGAGGDASLLAGDSGADNGAGTGSAGNLFAEAGSATFGNGVGGNAFFRGGDGAGTGAGGTASLQSGVGAGGVTREYAQVLKAELRGAQKVRVRFVADANYIVDSGADPFFVQDYQVSYTSLTAPRLVTLPDPTTLPPGPEGNCRVIVVSDASGGAFANNITVGSAGGAFVNGAAGVLIATDYGSLKFFTDGSNWFTTS